MRAVVFKKPYNVSIDTVDDPVIVEPTDAVVRITTAAICGSDLHMYEGRAPVQPGLVLGHENMGVIEHVGPGVRTLKIGQRVVLPFNIGCGFCFNCNRGFTSACLTANPQTAGAGYGYSGLGPHRGGQAELIRVPYADFNCLKLPGTPGDKWEDDFVLLADIFPTAYHATELVHIIPGDTVAIFGAGPVGLLAALSARIRGAAEIYVVDSVPERLALVREVQGAVPVDSSVGDPVEQILEKRKPHIANSLNLQPHAGDKMPGVMCAIDAIGYESSPHADPGRVDRPGQSLADCIRVTNPTGRVALIGVYFPEDPGSKDADAKHGNFLVALGEAWNKGLSIGMGQAPVKRYNEYLRDLIVGGLAKPSFIVSHRLPLEGAIDAYGKFDERVDGYTKVLLKPRELASVN